MPASLDHAPVRLALAEEPTGPSQAASWVGSLVTLGSRASHYAANHSGRQLIVALSVPQRDFAAALIGCGWVLASSAPELEPPVEVLRKLEPGTPLRVVTDHYVMTGIFLSLDETAAPPRVRFGSSTWHADKFKAVLVLPELDTAVRTFRLPLGSIGTFARLDETWDARLACPAADLAIVGTVTWLREDLDVFLSLEGDKAQKPTWISDLLLLEGRKVATWFTRLYASARFADQLPLPSDVRAVVLDGFGAIKYLAEIEALVVVCVVDRSVADETAAEIIVQLRNTRGEPISVHEDLRWRPPAGVEALAFTAPL